MFKFILDCGSVPPEIISVMGAIYDVLLIAIPILIVVFGLIDFIKAIMGKKDDEINAGAKLFIKRLIIGALAFFVLAFVKFVVNILEKSGVGSSSGVVDCLGEIFGNK